MSQFIQHPASSVKLSFAARRAAWLVSLVVLAVVAATAVILLVANGDDSTSAAPSPPAAQYNGGHEEGTAGASPSITLHNQSALHRQTSGTRFNESYINGPEEGTAGR